MTMFQCSVKILKLVIFLLTIRVQRCVAVTSIFVPPEAIIFIPTLSFEEEPPSPGAISVYHKYHNVSTHQGFNLPPFNLTTSITVPPTISIDQTLRPPEPLIQEKYGPPKNKTESPRREFKIISAATNTFKSLVANIGNTISRHTGNIGQTVERFSKRIESGANGIKTFIMDAQEKKSTSIQEFVQRVSSGSQSLLDRIRESVDGFGKGFQDFVQSIFEEEPEPYGPKIDDVDNNVKIIEDDTVYGTVLPTMDEPLG